MQVISQEVAGFLNNSSMIRRMFEAGIELKKQFGADNVYDFSLGNPDLPPPPEVQASLRRIAESASEPFALGYMPNAGYPATREKLAAKLTEEQGVAVPASHVIVTCGAAGGINAFFRAVLTLGDTVVVPSPYFVEYGFYAGNFGGKLVAAPSKPFTFELDLQSLEAAFSPATRAVILNSPHNPTGQIYSRAELTALAELMKRKSAEYGRVIYLIADEPYRFLNFDKVEIPSVFELYEHSVVIGSFSKSLSLAGERIGYIAVNPAMQEAATLLSALTLTNRILGFVNAPAIAQKILNDCLDAQVDLEIYRERRDAMAKVLREAGIEFTMPRGAFYFFPKSPVADEREFVDALLAERVLAVPGRGFGCPGYVRLTFCVSKKLIEASAPSFQRAMARLKK